MKRTMVVVAAMAMVLSFGQVVIGNAEAAGGNNPYNGVTYFDLGTPATCEEVRASVSQVKDVQPSNGITVFEMRESGAKGCCANKAEKLIMIGKGYNGITVF